MLSSDRKKRSSDSHWTTVPYMTAGMTAGKLFGLLVAGTFTFLVVIGFVVWLQAKVFPDPGSSMKGIAVAVPDEVFINLLGMEVAGLDQVGTTEQVTASTAAQTLFEWMTGINLKDPRTVLASEIGGLGEKRAVLFRKGIATDRAVYPTDHTPSQNVLKPVGFGKGNWQDSGDEANPYESDRDRGTTRDERDGKQSGADTGPFGPDDQNGYGAEYGEWDMPAASDARQRVQAFIYHSHNRESWIPELPGVTEPGDAYDATVNITLLGKRLAERLEEEGIGAKVSDKDYPSAVKDFNYNLSYSYSLKTVQEAAVTFPNLQYFFDIHRDSQRRDLTTANIDGVDYAQVYFVIGQKNPNWKANRAFAEQIHDRLEELYPGLSRGIFGKTVSTGHGEYNQHISPYAILIEVGGPENTLEESYRTIDILAEVIAEMIWDAEKVDLPVQEGEIVSASAGYERIKE